MNDFGNKIKVLRKNKKLTQEELADVLGVSFQSISKWETNSAMPDISLLPIIANYFEVTTDELLGVDISRINQKINNFEEEINNLYNEWKLEEAIELSKKVLIEFPNNYQIMIRLCYGLWHLGKLDELIEYSNKILNNDIDVFRKNNSIEYLIYSYSKKNMKEKALELAQKLPSCYQSRENIILKNNLFNNDHKYGYIGLVINRYLNIMENALEKFADVLCIKQYIGESKLSIDNRIKVIKK